MKKALGRVATEMGFIVFLFYSNLLMAEFNRSGAGRARGLLWAVSDIFTAENFTIALVAAAIGYAVAEFLRHKL